MALAGIKTLEARKIAARHRAEKLVLVASRRTDMPRFYLDEIIQGLNRGVFHPQPLMNPMFKLKFMPQDIHSVGLWSQDYSRWIERRSEVLHRYHYWYRVTLLPDDPLIKPVAPALDRQIGQVQQLARRDGPRAVNVCVDPLFHYRPLGQKKWRNPFTADFFERMMGGCADAGITSVTLSVIDRYKKVEARAKRFGVEFAYPDTHSPSGLDLVFSLAGAARDAAGRHGITLRSCCEPELVAAGLCLKGACTDGALLSGLFGPGASLKADHGQRKKAGCGCTLSLDVGRYIKTGPMSHHCGHDCPQCYAQR
jgi:hypothetical protein